MASKPAAKPSAYLGLLKPGIIRANSFAALAGYLFASGTGLRPVEMTAAFSGIALVISSACVFNNYFDRKIDAKMARTKKRGFVKGEVDVPKAMMFGLALLALGLATLASFTNSLAVCAALVGFITYVFVYTPVKKRSVHGTVLGAVAGAAPPVVGYTAYTGRLETAIWLIVIASACWQIAHTYAIHLHRLEEYKKSGVPLLPQKIGISYTKFVTTIYILAFIFTASLIGGLGYAGITYSLLTFGLGAGWLFTALYHNKKLGHEEWGKKVFKFSLIVMSAWSLLLALANILP